MYIKVRLAPGAKRESVTVLQDGSLSISVKEPAERTMANERARELVATQYKLPLGKVRLIAGFRSRSKIFSIPD